MKSFLQLIGEVAKAVSPADKEFVALHRIAKTQRVAYPEAQFSGGTVKDHSKLSEPSDATGIKADIEKEKPVTESWKQYLDEKTTPMTDDGKKATHTIHVNDDGHKIKTHIVAKDNKHAAQIARYHFPDNSFRVHAIKEETLEEATPDSKGLSSRHLEKALANGGYTGVKIKSSKFIKDAGKSGHQYHAKFEEDGDDDASGHIYVTKDEKGVHKAEF